MRPSLKLAPGTTQNNKVVYETEGIDFKVTTDGTDGAGNPTHSEWTGKFDGKDYPVKGDPIQQAKSSQARPCTTSNS